MGLPKDITLDDFKKLWNTLNEHNLTIAVPKSVGSKLFLWNSEHNQWDEYDCKNGKIGQAHSDSLHIGLLGNPERWAKLASRVGDDPPRFGYISADNNAFISLDQFNGVDFDGQGWFLAKNSTWKPGRFSESFADLDVLSAGVSNQNLETIEQVLKNKPNENAETFEAFGIKIPSEVVMRFGILLVIAVQMYFLTHLIELSKRLIPTDEGWEVAWVGVYSHNLARFVYFCTIAVLPTASIFALAKRATTQFSSLQGWGILVAAIAVDLTLAFWIWRKTPRRATIED